MALSEFPELKAVFDKLMAEKAVLVEKAKPYRDEYDKLQKQIQPLEAKARELAKKFHQIERPRLIEIDQQLSAIARSTGGRVMSEGEK
jgi:uncharacterized coiled-coil DUF342 family protein